jgi:glyoxylase-like metal-dependent hydrolase (beta-lactamase superfamily II)
MADRNPGIHRIAIGDIAVTALHDGEFQASTGALAGIAAADAEAELSKRFRRNPPWISVTAFLLTIDGRHILVDSGFGNARGPELGRVRPSLAKLGVKPADIGTVLVTHAHVDHVSGLVEDDGSATFPNAEVIINGAETAYWLDEARAASVPEAGRRGFEVAKRCLAPYRSKLRLVKDGESVLPSVSALHLPGHTPGHTGWLLSSGAEALLIWGDVVHMPAIQFPRPEAGMQFDVDVETARASRKRVFEMAATDRLHVAGMHLEFPTFGHVARDGAGFAFVADAYMP